MQEPMPKAQLFQEVLEMIEYRLRNRQQAPAAWITTAVVVAHPNITGDDVPFYVLCAYEHVRDTVREVLRSIKKEETENDGQQAFDGFEHLQKRYVIKRDDDQVVVRVDDMTGAEIEEKACELERMAAGCLAHARELRRYRDERMETAAR